MEYLERWGVTKQNKALLHDGKLIIVGGSTLARKSAGEAVLEQGEKQQDTWVLAPLPNYPFCLLEKTTLDYSVKSCREVP